MHAAPATDTPANSSCQQVSVLGNPEEVENEPPRVAIGARGKLLLALSAFANIDSTPEPWDERRIS
jgi:hypothetical protein